MVAFQYLARELGRSHDSICVAPPDKAIEGESSNDHCLLSEPDCLSPLEKGGLVFAQGMRRPGISIPRSNCRVASVSEHALLNESNSQSGLRSAAKFHLDTAKHYNYFRDYDPSISRYIESDPIGLDGGINTFSYALNNPALLIDPTGLIIGFGRQVDLGIGFAVPVIGRALGFGGGAGITFRQCCKGGIVYNEAFASARFGVSVGGSAQVSGTGKGTVGLGRIGPMPTCLAGDETNFFPGIDVAAGPLSVRIRKSILEGGISPGGGGSATLNLAERRWSLGNQKTDLKCDCP